MNRTNLFIPAICVLALIAIVDTTVKTLTSEEKSGGKKIGIVADKEETEEKSVDEEAEKEAEREETEKENEEFPSPTPEPTVDPLPVPEPTVEPTAEATSVPKPLPRDIQFKIGKITDSPPSAFINDTFIREGDSVNVMNQSIQFKRISKKGFLITNGTEIMHIAINYKE